MEQTIESTKLIKSSELARTISVLENNLNQNYDEHPHSLILNKAASLTEDLEEDDLVRSMEDRTDFSIVRETIKKTRKRKDYSTFTNRRSARLKIKTKINDA